MDRDRLQYLFHKYVNDSASGEELEELFSYIRQAGQQGMLRRQITQVLREVKTPGDLEKVDWDKMFSGIIAGPAQTGMVADRQIRKWNGWKRIAAAALIFILGAAATYLYFYKNTGRKDMVRADQGNLDIMPGGNRATLTLSNGARVILDSAGNGRLAMQGGTNVIKMGSGILTYHKTYQAGTKQEQEFRGIPYNTLSTPRGGQFQVTLSDGTKVWLNSASSIRFPVAFTGKERNVTVTGEVYFEVAHLNDMPFKVHVGKEVIEDLGTHFDINAYPDEPVTLTTTLLEGAVRMGNTVLRPGEQATVMGNGQIIVAKNPKAEDVIAWTEGFFAFDNANLQMVMRDLSRWYDIEVTYEAGANNEQRFSGRIDRSLTLAQILNGLKQTRAHFRIDTGRKVTILR